MNQISIFLCSPNRGGVTDTLAYDFYKGAEAADVRAKIYALRDYKIAGCIGCGNCLVAPHCCILDVKGDQTEELFAILQTSTLCLFCIPIYFYAMPAHFKAFIDRGQRFWAMQNCHKGRKGSNQAAIAILSAGRTKGKLLFSATLRTLRYFLMIFNIPLKEWEEIRGTDSLNSLSAHKGVQKSVIQFGKKWAEKVKHNEL